MASHLATTNSDSEDDDYVPPVEDESSGSSDEAPEAKCSQISPLRTGESDDAEKKKDKDALWASFQASVSSTPTQVPPEKETVQIKKRFKFAGEEIVKVVEVSADSPDAKMWPHVEEETTSATETLPLDKSCGPSPSEGLLQHTPTASTSVIKPPLKRPGPRKSKVTLAAIPTQKAKKLSTLEKSAMDWQAHVQSSSQSGLSDELEANRRGGGYLEKVAFLNRVDERRDDILESSKGSKRRRT